MNVMIGGRLSYPKIIWPTINGMFLEWSLIFWSKNLLLFGMVDCGLRVIISGQAKGTWVKGIAKIYPFLLSLFSRSSLIFWSNMKLEG